MSAPIRIDATSAPRLPRGVTEMLQDLANKGVVAV